MMQELNSGYTIKGRYKIVEKRGDGALGTAIFLGRDIENDSDVIIRVLPAEMLGDEESSTRFMQGADLAKRLKHPNILSVLDAGVDNDIEYLITNYEKGFFLNDYLEHRGSLDEKESIRLVKALGEALDYAWNEQQIIHRNICPDTILVAKGNIPLLTDFDLAKSLVADNKLTLEGFTIGDPSYMSPEQARGDNVDFHSDIYCLGLVLYQLLAGKPPFCDKSRMDILRAQVSEKHAPIQSKNKSITDACETVLDKMLAKEVKTRYQSWKTVISDFEAILNQELPSTLRKVVATATSSNYKMQAIQMPAVKVAVTEQKEENTLEEQKSPATSSSISSTESSSDTTVSAVSSKNRKRNMIIGAVLVVCIIVIIGILIGLMQKNTEKESLKTAASTAKQQQTKSESKSVVDIKNKPALKQESLKSVTAVDKVKEAKHRKACMNNIKQISVALQMYANVFEGKFPKPNGAKGLDVLRSGGFLETPQVYICPSSGNISAAPGTPLTEETCDYVYVGNLSEYSDDKTPILWSKPNNHKDYGIILYVNGDIKEYKANNWLSHTKSR